VAKKREAKHPAAGLGISYVRLSDVGNVHDPSSPDSQRRINGECAARMAVKLVSEFCDLDRPARKDTRRPQYEEAVQWLMERRAEYLIVPKLDRLSRRGMGHVGLLLDDLEEVGGKIVFAAEGLNTTQPGARQVIGFLAEQARAESDNISWRVRQWREYTRRRGEWRRPRLFGFVVGDDWKLRPHPTEAPIVRELATRYLKGASLRELSLWLNSQGVPPPSQIQAEEAIAKGHRVKGPKADEWGAATVRYILINPTYTGLQTHRGRTVVDDDGMPVPVGEGIVTPAEHARVMAEVDRRRAIVRKGKNASRIGGVTGSGRPPKYLLTSLVRCGECGGAMVVMVGKRTRPAYRCHDKSIGHRCKGSNALMDDLDREVVRRFTAKLASLEPRDPLLERVAERWLRLTVPEEEADRRVLQETADQADAALADLFQARYVRGEFPEAEDIAQYDQLRKRLLERRNAARQALDRLGPGPTVDVGALLETELSREAWERTTLHQKRSLLGLALTKVFVRGSDGGQIPMRERVHVVWIGDDDPSLPLREVPGKMDAA